MKPLTAIATIVLFGTFGYISCAQKDNKWLLIGIAVALGLVIVFVLLQLLKSGAGAVANNGTVAADALEHGILFMIPFAVLALLADLWLGWHSAQAFFSAGLSAVAITSGSVMMKNGGPRTTSIIIPMIWALAGGVAWMLITAKI